MAEKPPQKDRDLAVNRRARFEFEITETLETGMALTGPEVKSIRAGQISLDEAWVRATRDGLWLEAARVAEYAQAGRDNQDPVRPRRLLAHKREVTRLLAAAKVEGLQIVPLKVKTVGRWIKLVIGLGRSKKMHDKREGIKSREVERDMRRAVRKRA
jgi:SsrA-binding protein